MRGRPRSGILSAATLVAGCWLACLLQAVAAEQKAVEMSRDELADRIQGGLLGQVIGDLNGLPHEFKYIDKPGDVTSCVPDLSKGGRTDDDTDVEWVYAWRLEKAGSERLKPEEIVGLWKKHINRSIWSSNEYARQLMNIALTPPWTGHALLNPHASLNCGGQFTTEMFGLTAPCMPRTAAELGIYYAHTTLDGEALHSSQFFTTMLATAFVERDLQKLLDAGLASLDPKSDVHAVVSATRQLCADNPADWRATRQAIQQRFTRFGGVRPDINGYPLNTAAIVAAIIYGRGDFSETLRHSFNFGWDADCNAAYCGTLMGVIHGRRWMEQQGWKISDEYRNTTRDAMPEDETMTRYGQRLLAIAAANIAANGGAAATVDGKPGFRIARQQPAVVEPLRTREQQLEEAHRYWDDKLAGDLTSNGIERARAVYVAICLGRAEDLSKTAGPARWRGGIETLEREAPRLVVMLFKAPGPAGEELRRRASAAGLLKPQQ